MAKNKTHFECQKHGRLQESQVSFFIVSETHGEEFCGLCFQDWLAKTFPVQHVTDNR